MNLTAAEVAAVATALAAETATPCTHAGRSALGKILAVLAEVDAEGTRQLASRIRLFEARPVEQVASEAVEPAIVTQRVLDIDYADKTGAATSRSIEPLAVLGVQPHWYVWAWCRLRRDVRAFRLDRIARAVVRDEVPDRGLDPTDIELTDLISRGILGH